MAIFYRFSGIPTVEASFKNAQIIKNPKDSLITFAIEGQKSIWRFSSNTAIGNLTEIEGNLFSTISTFPAQKIAYEQRIANLIRSLEIFDAFEQAKRRKVSFKNAKIIKDPEDSSIFWVIEEKGFIWQVSSSEAEGKIKIENDLISVLEECKFFAQRIPYDEKAVYIIKSLKTVS
jgi:hypothetical protein